MIQIELAEHYKRCAICTKKENVYNIIFRYKETNQGTRVTLCDNCLKELKYRIEEVIR